jgi:hypothetical protein
LVNQAVSSVDIGMSFAEICMFCNATRTISRSLRENFLGKTM